MPVLAIADHQQALWTLCLAVGAGCLLTVLSRRLEIPTLVLLLIGGFVLGGEGLGLLHPEELAGFLPIVVSLAVGLILFEGGLTLDLKEFTHTSVVIKRLLTVGVLITWLGSALLAYLVFDVSPSFALLMGSLIIVTGPTVIVPLLRRIRLKQRLGGILHWEGVLIDSIGVFIAILCFEWVVEGGGTVALPNFLIRIVSGVAIGVVGGWVIYWFLHHGWVPGNIVNAFALAGAMLVFGVTELIKPEAGLLSVTIAGLIVGLKKPRQLRELKAFKAEIVDLLIGLLFLLLVARLELADFTQFFASGGGWILLFVIFVIRPFSVLVSSLGTNLSLKEKALLSWIAPRGVVAASMASLFALTLEGKDERAGDPALLESFVYSVICATVLVQGLTAGQVAKFLGLQRPAPNDWVIIGAHYFGRELAKRLRKDKDQVVVLLDSNARNIMLAREEELPALHCEAMEAEKLYEKEEMLFGAGYVFALTDSVELNELLMQRWAEQIGDENVFGWIPADSPTGEDQITGNSVFRDLSRPTVIGSELQHEESSFELVVWEEGKTLPSGDWHPLFLRRARQIRVLPRDNALKTIARPKDEVLCLRRSRGFLYRALQSGDFVSLACESLPQLHEQLVELSKARIKNISGKRVLEDLRNQEKTFPVTLRHGIAVPHVVCPELEHRICFVISLRDKLVVGESGEPLDFVFFLLSPVGDTEGHLATLAEIARDCHNDRLRERIKGAESLKELLALISS